MVQLRWWNLIDSFAEKFPNINKWLDRMEKVDGHDKMHKILDKLKPYLAQRMSKMDYVTSKL